MPFVITTTVPLTAQQNLKTTRQLQESVQRLSDGPAISQSANDALPTEPEPRPEYRFAQLVAENFSRIIDTDFALEISNLTKNQILQQAGTAMLSQANSLPQSVLELLRR
jgi:flagellin